VLKDHVGDDGVDAAVIDAVEGDAVALDPLDVGQVCVQLARAGEHLAGHVDRAHAARPPGQHAGQSPHAAAEVDDLVAALQPAAHRGQDSVEVALSVRPKNESTSSDP
jgi:hypothetical protein